MQSVNSNDLVSLTRVVATTLLFAGEMSRTAFRWRPTIRLSNHHVRIRVQMFVRAQSEAFDSKMGQARIAHLSRAIAFDSQDRLHSIPKAYCQCSRYSVMVDHHILLRSYEKAETRMKNPVRNVVVEYKNRRTPKNAAGLWGNIDLKSIADAVEGDLPVHTPSSIVEKPNGKPAEDLISTPPTSCRRRSKRRRGN